MAFHADFWVVVGTAAPVILLAQMVMSADALVARSAAIGRRRVQEHSQTKIAARSYMLSTGNIILQGGMLVASLGSLSIERDTVPTAVILFAMIAGLALLLFTTLDMAMLRISQARESQSAKD